MANSLLDFVMSVVRDPDAAAAYAANPTQAIADANLTDVTSVDVNNLIPVVAESLSAVVPSGSPSAFSGGADTLGDAAHNVWASGAATAAFDAFDDHLPLQSDTIDAVHQATIIDQPADAAPTISDHVIDDGATASDPSLVMDAPAFSDVHAADIAPIDDAVDAVDAGHHFDDAHDHAQDHPQDPGFDIFT